MGIFSEELELLNPVTKRFGKGHLGGSVSWASHFGSGHDLTACEFKPCVGLCADSSEPGIHKTFKTLKKKKRFGEKGYKRMP